MSLPHGATSDFFSIDGENIRWFYLIITVHLVTIQIPNQTNHLPKNQTIYVINLLFFLNQTKPNQTKRNKIKHIGLPLFTKPNQAQPTQAKQQKQTVTSCNGFTVCAFVKLCKNT